MNSHGIFHGPWLGRLGKETDRQILVPFCLESQLGGLGGLGGWGFFHHPSFGSPKQKGSFFGKDKNGSPGCFSREIYRVWWKTYWSYFNLPKNLCWFHETIVWLNLKPRMWASKARKKPKNGNIIRITFGCPGTEVRIYELGVSNIPYTFLD